MGWEAERSSDDPGRPFRDRKHAGAFLAECLAGYRGKDVLVLGIPRGGVIVAAEVARRLEAELDVIVARKLGAPYQPELAIGAITANGGQYLNEKIIHEVGVPESYLHDMTRAQMQEAHRREESFRGSRPAPRLKERIVLVVDDGLATGATMRAAVRSVRSQQPARLVAAVPVGSRESCAALRPEVDELVCPHMPKAFYAVGQFYDDFEPTQDEEVREVLQDLVAARISPKRRGAGSSAG